MASAGRPEEGLEYMRRARELDPLSPIVLTDLGRVLMTAGRFAQADSILASALELEPEYPPALDRLGERAMLAGDPQAVRAYGERYVAAIDTANSSLLGLAINIGDGPLAVRRLRDIMPTDSSRPPPDLRFDLVRVLFPLAQTDGDAAAAAFADAQIPHLRDTDPEYATALEGIAAALRGDRGGAEAADRRLRSMSPDDDEYWLFRVYIARALEDGSAAVALIDQNVSLERWLIEWRYTLEHGAHWAGMRDDPAIREFVDGPPPYVPLSEFLEP